MSAIQCSSLLRDPPSEMRLRLPVRVHFTPASISLSKKSICPTLAAPSLVREYTARKHTGLSIQLHRIHRIFHTYALRQQNQRHFRTIAQLTSLNPVHPWASFPASVDGRWRPCHWSRPVTSFSEADTDVVALSASIACRLRPSNHWDRRVESTPKRVSITEFSNAIVLSPTLPRHPEHLGRNSIIMTDLQTLLDEGLDRVDQPPAIVEQFSGGIRLYESTALAESPKSF